MTSRARKNKFSVVFRAALFLTAVLIASSCSGSPAGNATKYSRDPDASASDSAIDPAEYIGTLDEEMSGELILLTNALRNSNDLAPFETNEDMADWARVRAAEIVFSFDHVRIDGSDIITAFRGESYTRYYSAIARGYGQPENILSAWMTLEHQRNNILSSEFTHVGAACLWHEGMCYCVMVFLCP